jgi:hypothetical protein
MAHGCPESPHQHGPDIPPNSRGTGPAMTMKTAGRRRAGAAHIASRRLSAPTGGDGELAEASG